VFRSGAIVGGVCLAVALGGCSLTPTKTSGTAGFTGAKADIATALNLLASDASSSNGADICKSVLANAVRSELNKLGTCATIIDNQLKTTDDSTLTVKSITINGANASAQVETVHDRNKVISTVKLARQNGLWRIASI
jgi:hypothetical protein